MLLLKRPDYHRPTAHLSGVVREFREMQYQSRACNSIQQVLWIKYARLERPQCRIIIYTSEYSTSLPLNQNTLFVTTPLRNHASPSFASIFRLAARIISSLLLFNPSALTALSELHAFRFCSSLGTGSLPFPLIFDCSPYRVIKSGWLGEGLFSPLAPLAPCPAVAGGGRFGWNEGGGLSKPLPPKTLSVVAATFPPFRCRSHAIALRSSCGNIADTWSTLLTSTCRSREEELGVDDAGLLRNHRIARKPTSATAMSCGMLIEVWLSAMLDV